MRRRAFLRLSTLGAVAGAFGPLAASPPVARAWDPDAPTSLEPDHREILAAVAERMVDTGEPAAPTIEAAGVLARVDRLLAVSDPDVTRGLTLALGLVDLWPVLFELRFRRFRSLEADERDASLEGWRTSRLAVRRRVFAALRAVSFYGYWSDPATWELIGYGGPWIGRRA